MYIDQILYLTSRIQLAPYLKQLRLKACWYGQPILATYDLVHQIQHIQQLLLELFSLLLKINSLPLYFPTQTH